MANVVKKHSISSELAQKMVDAAAAKAREIGVRARVKIRPVVTGVSRAARCSSIRRGSRGV